MNITWVTRGFLDYRIPVYKALDELCNHKLTVIYYKDVVPERCQIKLSEALGDRAIPWEKELRIGNLPKIDNKVMSNTKFRIPYSPGLIKMVKCTNPDVLISDGFMQWTYAALWLRATKRIPHVMCYERTEYTERNAGKIRPMYRKIVSRWIDVIDCNGSLTGKYVKSLLGWDDSRLTYGHMVADVRGMRTKMQNVTDNDVKELREKLGVKGIMLLFVGQLIPRKGVKELLEAWSEFKNSNFCNIKDCTLVYVGHGQMEDELRKTVVDDSIPDVVFTGGIEYDNIAKYYKAADCFIIPTLEDNWSLVVPEAMACGLPIATSKYNGCHPELVHADNGWVFDPFDRENLITVLCEIMNEKTELSKMGEVSRRRAAAETAERAAQSIMEAIIKAKKY